MRQILMQGMGKFQLQNVWAPDPGWRAPDGGTWVDPKPIQKLSAIRKLSRFMQKL